MKTILLALGFMAVFEAILPMVNPEFWQKMLKEVSLIPASQVRRVALAVIVLALTFIWAIDWML